MTRCPACSSLMFRMTAVGVEVDGCPGCGGIWLDKGELPKLSADPNVLRSLGNGIRATQPAAAPQRTDSCPRCNQPLSPFEFGTLRGIRLDRCKSCEGIWLDAGEAQSIAERLGAAAQSFPAASAAPAAAAAGIAARFGAPADDAGASAATGPRTSGARAGAAPADPTSTAGMPVVRGQPMSGYASSSGFFGSIERGFRFILGAYKLALESPSLMTPLILGGLFQALIGGASVVFFALANRHGHAGTHVVSGGILAAMAIAFVFAIQFVNMTILGMTVSMVDAYLKGLPPRLSTAFQDVMKNLGAVLAMSAVSTAVEMLTAKNKHGRRGFLGEIVHSLWTVMSFLLMPIIMIEDVGLGRALIRARDIHQRGILQVAVGEVGLRAIAGLSMMLAMGVVGLFALMLLPLTLAKGIGLAVLAILIVVPLLVLNAFARGAYYTCLYLWVAEIERVGEAQAMVPGPLATALVSSRD